MSERNSVLVLEDEALIALDLESMLSDAGWQVIGPAGTLSKARALLDGMQPDLACLDLNIGDTTSHDLARDLLSRGVPVVFISGRDVRALPDDLRGVPLLGKPIDESELHRTLRAAVSA
jgi:DNA-binding response OmpR family regulator